MTSWPLGKCLPVGLPGPTLHHAQWGLLPLSISPNNYVVWNSSFSSTSFDDWCFWTAALEKTLESPSYCKKIKPVHPKENQSWIFIGRTDAEAEALILWPPDAKSWLIWKDPVSGKDWRQEEKVMTEDKMVGWHHWLDRHEFEQARGDGDGQGSLACCSPWGRKESDMTEWTELSSPDSYFGGCGSTPNFAECQVHWFGHPWYSCMTQRRKNSQLINLCHHVHPRSPEASGLTPQAQVVSSAKHLESHFPTVIIT